MRLAAAVVPYPTLSARFVHARFRSAVTRRRLPSPQLDAAISHRDELRGYTHREESRWEKREQAPALRNFTP